MPLPADLKFSCSALPTYNGHTVKVLEPDENGCYDVVLGCVGAPTRANVIYEPNSLIGAMADPSSRFNICLRDGNLFGEWGHPDIYGDNGQQDIKRLLKIDESKQSHVFYKIWIDDVPINIHGAEAYPIRAKVKPMGPYGAYLEKSLRDPIANTAFSLRSLCMPEAGPDSKYEYRKIQLLVTFDAVGAPGYEIATKRYVGNESFEVDVSRQQLNNVVHNSTGMESVMLADKDISRIYNEHSCRVNGTTVTVAGKRSLLDANGNLIDSASLIYRRNR
jgi:hypothetical protein